jgi:hypothetical protein
MAERPAPPCPHCVHPQRFITLDVGETPPAHPGRCKHCGRTWPFVRFFEVEGGDDWLAAAGRWRSMVE